MAEINDPSQLRINGKQPTVLAKKVKLSDVGKNWKKLMKEIKK